MVFLLALAVLAGWATDVRVFKTLGVSNVTVKPNTAIALGLCALALMIAPRDDRPHPVRTGVSSAAALFAALICGLTIFEYATGRSFGIDQLVFDVAEDAHLTPTPGRMALITASALTALGAGIFMNVNKISRTAGVCQILMVAAGSLALTSLLGYTYGAIPTSGLGQGVQIAIPTAFAILLLASGALALRPDIGWVATMRSDHAGGVLARRMLPFVVVVPFSLGAFRVLGNWMTPFSVATQTAIVAVLTMLSFGVVIWRTALSLDAADRQRRAAERDRLAIATQEEAARARADAAHEARGVAEKARDEAELASREKAEALTLLEVVLSSAPTGFAMFDRQCRYLRVNRKLAEINGISEDAHVGKSIRQMAPDVSTKAETAINQVFATGSPVVNIPFTRPGRPTHDAPSGERHFLGSFYPIAGSAGEPIAVGLILIETTSVRFLEEQLTQSQKMEAVGQLAGGIAHDFNNLLTVITVYSALLLEDMGDDDPKSQDVREIRGAAERASVLTRQLLAFSRKQVIQPRRINLNDVIAGVGRMLPRLLGEDITIETATDPTLSLIHADPGQIEQVLVNLSVNARDAMPDGGRLRISTSNGTFEPEEKQDGSRFDVTSKRCAVLSVSDTGTGMSPEVLRRVFEPFFTTKGMGKGTGLGLSTVYGIVNQSGGEIRVYSEPGEGTTFNIYFPALPTDSTADISPPEQTDVRGGSETILLVEDDPKLILLSERILGRLGYTVLLARNGEEAIETMETHGERVDLVVSDVVMPLLSGGPLAEKLRLSHPSVPVMFMSGYTNDEVTRRGILEGQVPFIQKPFSPDEFARKIREVLDSA